MAIDRHEFLAGEDLTLADIQLGHVLYRNFDIAIARPALPALRRYYDRLAARPAFREHVMVPYEELLVPWEPLEVSSGRSKPISGNILLPRAI